MALQYVVVQHPKLERVKYTVPAGDEARWLKQHWKKTDDVPAAAPADGTSHENLTVAQRIELGLPATAGEDVPAAKPAKAKPAKTEPAE